MTGEHFDARPAFGRGFHVVSVRVAQVLYCSGDLDRLPILLVRYRTEVSSDLIQMILRIGLISGCLFQRVHQFRALTIRFSWSPET